MENKAGNNGKLSEFVIVVVVSPLVLSTLLLLLVWPDAAVTYTYTSLALSLLNHLNLLLHCLSYELACKFVHFSIVTSVICMHTIFMHAIISTDATSCVTEMQRARTLFFCIRVCICIFSSVIPNNINANRNNT